MNDELRSGDYSIRDLILFLSERGGLSLLSVFSVRCFVCVGFANRA